MKKFAMLVLISTLGATAKAETALTQLQALSRMEPGKVYIALPPSSDSGDVTPLPGTDSLGVCEQLGEAAKPGLPQAASLVQACLDQAYRQGVWSENLFSVRAKPGRFFIPLCPQTKGEASCQAMVEVEGIVITVTGKLRKGDDTLAKLASSLARRQNKLLGWPVQLLNAAEDLPHY